MCTRDSLLLVAIRKEHVVVTIGVDVRNPTWVPKLPALKACVERSALLEQTVFAGLFLASLACTSFPALWLAKVMCNPPLLEITF